MIEAVIKPRRNAEGNQFTEVLLTETTEDGRQRHYLTRYWHVLTDDPATRAAEVGQFLHRRKRWPNGRDVGYA